MKKIYAVMLAIGFLATGAIQANGSASESVEPPIFLFSPDNQWVFEGQTVRFPFKVSGSPAPIVKVYKEGQLIRLENELKYNLSNKEGNVTFTIYWVDATDAGHYTFVAENAAGFASRSVTLGLRE